MVKELNLLESTPLNPANMLTGSGFAIEKSEKRWYIAECKPTKETIIRAMLKNAHYESYIASRYEEKVYANRTRHVKEKIMIPGKVFVRTEETNLMRIMLDYSSVWRFMMNRLSKNRTYACVPENEMEQLQYVMGHADNPVHITADDLKVDQKVKVMRGALAGLEGWFYKEGHTSFIVIKVTMGTNHYVYTEVPIDDIQPV